VDLRDIALVLSDRAAHAGLTIPEDLGTKLVVYYQVLAHWNRKINLTALNDPEEAVDRLLLEPVSAAQYLPRAAKFIDLGSGGGSPAIPLALALGAARLVMVESRVRKAAFLREALRELAMTGSVETARFEDLAGRSGFSGAFDLASIRAVRLDAAVLDSLAGLLRTAGYAALFRAVGADRLPGLPATLEPIAEYQLIPASHSALEILQKR
jgi:16S rRNA (guanine527-N7)-methyltransferase